MWFVVERRITELEGELRARDELLRARGERIAELEVLLAKLEAKVAGITARSNQNSTNSHQPPSSDSPNARKRRRKRKKKPGSTRKRGAQPKHKAAQRELQPADKVTKFVDLFPSECESCFERLPEVCDPLAKRYQQVEAPPVKPDVTEWRRHEVACPSCAHKSRAAYDTTQIPASPFGPRLMAIMALFTGVYHLSRRRTVELLSDIVGVRVSLGALSAVEARVSNAVQPAVDEAWTRVGQASVKHTDGTSWCQSGLPKALWTLATTTATVFKIVANNTKATLRPLYGGLHGILISDRAKALNFWAMERRQICWAHLLRKYVSFSERDGPGAAFGRQLLDLTGIIFEYWHGQKTGKLSRKVFLAWMIPVRMQVETLLKRAVAAKISGVSGSCADILLHKAALWTFTDTQGVEPTNNHAEQQIRAFVLWRKRSFGTKSARGNVFAENLMSIAHTARKQNRNVLTFLTACCQASRTATPSPSLFQSQIPAAA